MSSQDNIESHSVKDGSLLSSSFSDKNESNPVTIPIPDDYEDTSYEEIQADREPDLELSISDTQLNDTTYQTLFHRYNLEEGQVLRLRNQAVFILTVLGFLLTNSIGIIGSDWFKLTTLSSIPFMWYIVLAVMIFFCVLLSVGIIIFIEFGYLFVCSYNITYFSHTPSSSHLPFAIGLSLCEGRGEM